MTDGRSTHGNESDGGACAKLLLVTLLSSNQLHTSKQTFIVCVDCWRYTNGICILR